MTAKRLSIILPSYNDTRVRAAIASVREFDDIDAVKLVIIDGGSRPEVVDILRNAVRPDDILVSEPDNGIFDALNKGLDRVDTDFIGWLGADDLFTSQVKASDVVAALETHDLFVTSVAVFLGDRVRRKTSAWGCASGLARFGLHNPHYGTFGRAAVLKHHRFRLDLKGSDIDYFLEVFVPGPSVAATSAIGTLQGEGGFSTGTYRKMVGINAELLAVYRKWNSLPVAAAALATKLIYKSISSIRYRLFRLDTRRVLAGHR